MTAPDRHPDLSDGPAEPLPGLDAPAEMARRFALIIATSDYDDPSLSQLRSPGRDAEEMAELLGDPSIGAFEVQTLTAPRLTDALLRIFEFCEARDPDDLALVYLSCHGILDDHGQLYYATCDTRCNALAATAVASRWLNEMLEDYCRARQQILILDCCHSGAFARGAKGGSPPLPTIQEQFGGRGRVVLTASRAMEYSFEGERITGDGVRSVFTSTLAQGLRTGNADHDGDGLITVKDLYDYVYRHVRTVDNRQTPVLWAYGSEGDLYVAYGVRGIIVEPLPLPDGLRAELESPRPRVRAAAVEELATLMESGEPGIALTARNTLERVAKEDLPLVAEAAQAALNAQPAVKPQAAVNARGPAAPPGRPAPSERTGLPRPSAPTERAAPPEPPEPAGPTSQPRITPWQAVAGATVAHLAASEDVLYVANADQYIYAFDASNGRRRWRSKLGGNISALAASRGTVYAAADRQVAALGELRWTFEAEATATAIALGGGVVYVGTSGPQAGRNSRKGHAVFALDAGNGSVNWRAEPGAAVTAVAVAGAAVYVGAASTTHKGHVLALDAAYGKQNWREEADAAVTAVAVAGEAVYTGTSFGQVCALHARSGKRKWYYDVNDDVNKLMVHDGVVYVSTEESVYALEAESGYEDWSREFHSIRMIAVSGDALYIGTPRGIIALNVRTGELVREASEKFGVSVLLASGNTLYVCSGQRINAFDRTEENWPL